VLALAAGEAALREGRLLAVHAADRSSTDIDFLHPTHDQLVAWGERLVERALEPVRARRPDLRIETRVESGHPVDVVTRAADEADLLVLGSRGHGRVVGTVLGSVSLHLLLQARRPTVVTTSRRT
jgi:nucleotide-binding universal stress UspA family protein